jgi:repressor LexA
MKNAGICDKDVIVVEQNAYPNDGDIVVARIDGEEVTVKRFFQKGKEIELRPENEAFSHMFFAPERVEILGSVTGLMRRY